MNEKSGEVIQVDYTNEEIKLKADENVKVECIIENLIVNHIPLVDNQNEDIKADDKNVSRTLPTYSLNCLNYCIPIVSSVY